MITLLFLVIAVSLDSWGTGLAYGLQNIGIKETAIGLIGLASALVFALAMGLGSVLAQFLEPEVMNILGAAIVISLGIYALIRSSFLAVKHDKMLLEIAIGHIGILVKIINNKKEADLDRSGVISNKEACYLGLALSLDTFGVGIGAALLELDLITGSLAVGIGAALSLALGLYIGGKMGEKIGYDKMRAVPGMILICIGLSRIIGG